MSYRSHMQFQSIANPLCSLGGLRRLEDHLDWLENHRPRGRFVILVSPLLPVIAIATAWLWKACE